MRKKNNLSFYTADMKMAELVQSNYQLLLLLPRFGMELGVGEDSITVQCKRHGAPEEVETVDVEQLLSYLSRSHTYYMESRIRPIEQCLKNIADHYEAPQGNILMRFFAEYIQEVLNHFEYEEKTVFPYIRDLQECRKLHPEYDIETFEKNHSNIDDKLSDLKNILIKYLPNIGMVAEQTELLFQIFSLEDDLSRHTFIEDVVLIPLVRHMEILSHDK